MAIVRDPLSPLIHAKLVSVDDVIFWDKSRFPVILPRDDDTPYLVQKGERIDNLAFLQLGSTRLSWVIMVRNELGLAPNDLVPGAAIFIPSLDGLRQRGII